MGSKLKEATIALQLTTFSFKILLVTTLVPITGTCKKE